MNDRGALVFDDMIPWMPRNRLRDVTGGGQGASVTELYFRSADWREFWRRLMDAMAPFPDAWRAVADAMERWRKSAEHGSDG